MGERPSDESPAPRRARSRKKPRLLLLCAAAVLLMLLLGGVLLFFSAFSGGSASGPVTVVVEEGESLSGVSRDLAESGAIGSATIFELRARLEGLDTGIKPGEYRIDPGRSDREILATLTAGGEEPTVEVSVPEGLTLEGTARRVAEQSGISVPEFLRAARRTDYGYEFLEEEGINTTEGFLFPKRYEFLEDASAPEMVNRMLGQYAAETRGLDFQRARRELGLTEYEIVTAASLIERETAGGERPVIASVIYNRLDRDMPLQIDATVRYALDEPEGELSLEDLEAESPYNTYQRNGLPPGPIASPGLPSIKAALYPADTDYLYYVLDRDGEEHTFTRGYEEFLRAKERAGR